MKIEHTLKEMLTALPKKYIQENNILKLLCVYAHCNAYSHGKLMDVDLLLDDVVRKHDWLGIKLNQFQI